MAKVNAVTATLQLDDGSTLPYESWGEPGNRPIVLLCPANVDPAPLRALAVRLAADFPVKLVSLPGDRRGGDWSATPQELRSSDRGFHLPAGRAPFIGFRLAQDL